MQGETASQRRPTFKPATGQRGPKLSRRLSSAALNESNEVIVLSDILARARRARARALRRLMPPNEADEMHGRAIQKTYSVCCLRLAQVHCAIGIFRMQMNRCHAQGEARSCPFLGPQQCSVALFSSDPAGYPSGRNRPSGAAVSLRPRASRTTARPSRSTRRVLAGASFSASMPDSVSHSSSSGCPSPGIAATWAVGLHGLRRFVGRMSE